MGSEQSNQGGEGTLAKDSRSLSRAPGQLRRGKSVPEPKRAHQDDNPLDGSRPGSCSPGLSVCSDSDLPYISYTVNRPIGDSPKMPAKGGQLIRGKSVGTGARKGPFHKLPGIRSAHNIVVVKSAAKEETTEKDPDILRLQGISMFLPIMRGTLNLPAARDPEVLERLDSTSLFKLCLRCQNHFHDCAITIAEQQNQLTAKVKEVDAEISHILTSVNERYKSFGKHSENLSRVNELTAQIGKCHLALNKTLETVERLNNMLPTEDRLEPFVWTTG
ncbi:hypothetical protein AAG570_000077 [Ranatra chinensis]|uniref:BLOC-1-related complex subunit 5 n=1 Tax=Ranatra chinensis TaxID=642074 RepID=A0ABD0YW18_9HEMI